MYFLLLRISIINECWILSYTFLHQLIWSCGFFSSLDINMVDYIGWYLNIEPGISLQGIIAFQSLIPLSLGILRVFLLLFQFGILCWEFSCLLPWRLLNIAFCLCATVFVYFWSQCNASLINKLETIISPSGLPSGSSGKRVHLPMEET